MMQMIHDSLMPEAMSKFLREEALRPTEPMFTTTLASDTPVRAIDVEQTRLDKLHAELTAKRDREAEAADRAAFERRHERVR